MNYRSVRLRVLLMACMVVMSWYAAYSQNSTIGWSAFSSGFGAPSSPGSVVNSSIGEVLVGAVSSSDMRIESGFLASPMLRGPLTGVSESSDEGIPVAFSLSQNFPNPFNPSTTIRYQLPRPAHVVLKLFSVLGQEVATLVNETQQAGTRSVVWNAVDVSSGVYFYRIQADSYSATMKLVLLK